MKDNIKELSLEEEAEVSGGYVDSTGTDVNYTYENAVGPVGNAVGPVKAVGPVGNAVGPVKAGPLDYPYKK